MMFKTEARETMKIDKRERGQSLVELSISLVILLYLLSGAVEFGIAFFQFVQLRDAAQEGALYGSMNPGQANRAFIEQRVRNASNSPINLADSAVDVTVAINNSPVWQNGSSLATPTTACEGNSITLTVQYDHAIFMPFIPQLIGRSTLPLTATVTDTILTPVCPAT